MIKPIVLMGAPKLYEESKAVEHFNNKLTQLTHDMEACMLHYGGVGIAAPQIGVNLQVILYGFEHNARYPSKKSVPKTVLINPVITNMSEKRVVDWEGCLSVPGLRGQVERAYEIGYQAYTVEGDQVNKTALGFEARIIQHEIDHLQGVLFPQRLIHPKAIGFETALSI